jgi:tubulin polyglutamylase TTLL4
LTEHFLIFYVESVNFSILYSNPSFKTTRYSNSSKNITDKYIHLTNFSINKSNKDYQANDDETSCNGHKWSIKALFTYLKRKGINTDKIWAEITDLVVKTIICADPHVNVLVKSNLRRKQSVYELFGFDVILDQTLKPWIVEVNISPSLHSASPLDVNVKGRMIADLFNLVGYRVPCPRDVKKSINVKG